MSERSNPCRDVNCNACCRSNTVALVNQTEVAHFANQPNVIIFDASPLETGQRMVVAFEDVCPNHTGVECSIHEKDSYPLACSFYEFGGAMCQRQRTKLGLTPANPKELLNPEVGLDVSQ